MVSGILFTLLACCITVFFITCIYFWRLTHIFLKRLGEIAPAYYESIGRPMPQLWSYEKVRINRQWRANTYMMALLLRGVPKGFPHNAALRETAKKLRRIWFSVALPAWLGALITLIAVPK